MKALLDAGWDDNQEVAAAARNALKNPVHQAMGNQLGAPATKGKIKTNVKSIPETPNAATTIALVISIIGIFIGLNGIQALMVDSNVLGLYYNIPLALVLLGIAWVIHQAGRG